MSKLGDEPAYPKIYACGCDHGKVEDGAYTCDRCDGLGYTHTGGLTKRELLAAMAMQGLMGAWVTGAVDDYTMPSLVADACEMADLQLAELAKENEHD